MKKHTLQLVSGLMMAGLLSTGAYAQQKDAVRVQRTNGQHEVKTDRAQLTRHKGHDAFKGVVRVKFKNTPDVVAKLDRMMKAAEKGSTLRASSGALSVAEFPGLSAVNARMGAVEMKRVFRPAGKFEARHREHGLHLWYEVKVNDNANLEEVLATYGRVAEIQIAEPRYAMSLQTLNGTPNDPRYSSQAGHYDLINTVQAWGIETGDSRVVVAIEDQGVDYNHPDLAGHMWNNPGEIAGNGIDDDNNGYVDDFYGYNFGNDNGNIAIDYHGTHVGGTVAAETNNGVGVAGVAGGSGNNDGVRLMTLSVFGNNAQGGFDEAFIYAADNGAAISQNSWGGGAQSTALENAINYFIANGGGGIMTGGLAVFAAGNDNSSSTSVGYPASFAPVIAVASTTHAGVKSSFSNYGSWVDIAAPGSNIHSTYPVSQNSYNTISGTSMACPHVSGVAALVLSNKVRNGQTISATQLRNILESSSNNSLLYSNNPSFTGQLGKGMLDAYAALTGQVAPPPPPPSCSASYVTDVTLTLVTDGYATETSWTLKDNANGATVASGNGYGNNTTNTRVFQLAAGGNYTFTINDSYGDGICCSYGNGSYTLKDGKNVTIASGSSFGSSASTTFCIEAGSAPGNTAPVAKAGGPYSGNVGSAITFNGAGSTDADGDALTYSWNFGNGSTGSGVNPTHTYTVAGTYTVTLTVSDGTASSQATATVTVNAVPAEVCSGGSNLSATRRNWLRYTWTIPAGATKLNVTTTANNGDADLYVRYNTAPSTSSYTARSIGASSNESLQVNSPTAGTWHIGIYAYATFSGLTLNACYTNGAGVTVNQVIDIPAGKIEEMGMEEAAPLAYPNPAKDVLYVNAMEEGASFEIVSLTGQVLVRGVSSNGTEAVDVSSLQKGMYMLVIEGEKGKITHRFVKQ